MNEYCRPRSVDVGGVPAIVGARLPLPPAGGGVLLDGGGVLLDGGGVELEDVESAAASSSSPPQAVSDSAAHSASDNHRPRTMLECSSIW
jgi:hypothetical protein